MSNIRDYVANDRWYKKLHKDLADKRYEHTLRVAETALHLAECHDYDREKAVTAALLHDCAKNYKDKKLLENAEKFHIPISDAAKENTDLLHAKVGAWIARTYFKVEDPDVFNAIAYHTTGRPSMSILEKIIYISDYSEPGRKHRGRLELIRTVAETDLDLAVYYILEDTLAYLTTKSKTKDPLTIESYHYYRKLKEGNHYE